MKLRYILLILFLIQGFTLADDDLENHRRWLKAGDTWYSRGMNLADQSPSMSPEERFKVLGRGLGVGTKKNLTDEESKVFRRIQTILVSTPGHANYQKKIIEDALTVLESLPESQKLGYLCGYRRTQGNAFNTLELLPSPQTVRVLGDFLADERGGLNYKEGDPLPNESELTCYQVQNYLCAATALYTLIDDPLSKKKLTDANRDEQYLDWRLWYNQIKAGTKPIRFKGDPKEYYLENVGRVPEANRAARRPSVENHISKESSKASKPVPIPWIVGIIAVILTGISWILLGRRKAN